jgi:hypothetical protein
MSVEQIYTGKANFLLYRVLDKFCNTVCLIVLAQGELAFFQPMEEEFHEQFWKIDEKESELLRKDKEAKK